MAKVSNLLINVEIPVLDCDKNTFRQDNVGIWARMKLERRVVGNMIAYLETKGFKLVSVFDGEKDTNVKTLKKAMEIVFNLDECQIYFSKTGRNTSSSFSVVIVLGNDGYDAISDWTYPDSDPERYFLYTFKKAMEEFTATTENYIL